MQSNTQLVTGSDQSYRLEWVDNQNGLITTIKQSNNNNNNNNTLYLDASQYLTRIKIKAKQSTIAVCLTLNGKYSGPYLM